MRHIANEATATLADGLVVGIRQETEYTSAGSVAITIDTESESEFSLALRIPRWCEGASLRVNGEEQGQAPPAR